MEDNPAKHVKDQIAILVKLQDVEGRTQKISCVLNKVNERLDALNLRLAEFENLIAEHKSELDGLKKSYRASEGETLTRQDQIAKSQAKLRAVKTNREYQSLLKEIDDLKAGNSKIEDTMLESLDRIEAAEKAIGERDREYQALKEEVEREKKMIEEEAEENRRKLALLAEEREAISSAVEPEFLSRFKAVKAMVGPLAVAPVSRAVCQGCHVNIRPQLYNELQRCDTLLLCPNCQRIIYYCK
jgi:predicted  nucleic acid-binding Zn-ribbon protein